MTALLQHIQALAAKGEPLPAQFVPGSGRGYFSTLVDYSDIARRPSKGIRLPCFKFRAFDRQNVPVSHIRVVGVEGNPKNEWPNVSGVALPFTYGNGALTYLCTGPDLIRWLHWPYDGTVAPLTGESCDEVFFKCGDVLKSWHKVTPVCMVAASWIALHEGVPLHEPELMEMARDFKLATEVLASGSGTP